jgi:glycosyltransferase involved in cell wall biosynthesis
MKKILILSHHFEPMNVIATQRAMGYANHFKKFGFEPTFVTHQRSERNEVVFCEQSEILKKVIIEDKEKYKVYRFSVGKHRRGQLLTRIENSKWNKLGILFSWIFGHLDTRGSLLNTKLTERIFLKEHLKTHQYDLIMGIFSPHYHLSNCYWAHKKFNTSYVLDYRDLWDERLTIPQYKFSFTHSLRNFFCRKYWKKWNSKALFHTITSKEWSTVLTQITHKKGFVITNGFEKDDFFPWQARGDRDDEFKIVHIGTLYNHQKLEVFLEGMSLFIASNPTAKIKLYLIGAKRKSKAVQGDNGYLIDPENILREFFPKQHYEITSRVDRKEALLVLKQANLLYFPGVTDVKGRHFGKIFEYIASGVKTVVAPSDKSSVEELIVETEAGVLCNSANEVFEFLEKEWNNELIDFSPDKSAILNYSRESQTSIYAEYICNYLK